MFLQCIVKWIFLVFLYLSDLAASKAPRRLKHSNTEAMRIIAQELVNSEFHRDLEPLLIPRMPDTDGNKLVQKIIKDRLTDLHWDIEEDRFENPTPYGVKTFTNIIATYEPSAPKRLVLACHFDSKNITDKRSGKEFIGATDSAVPCAILLDAAKQLDCMLRKSDRKKAKDVTLQLVFFDGEEAYKDWTDTDSLYGARHLAEKWQGNDRSERQLHKIEALILLDLIGEKSMKFRNFFGSTAQHFEALSKIEEHLKNKKLLNPKGVEKNYPMFLKSPYPGGVQDDHIPFMTRGVPILHLISVPFPSVWHKMSDNGDAIDHDVVDNFNRIFRTFLANYLHLEANRSGCPRNVHGEEL